MNNLQKNSFIHFNVTSTQERCLSSNIAEYECHTLYRIIEQFSFSLSQLLAAVTEYTTWGRLPCFHCTSENRIASSLPSYQNSHLFFLSTRIIQLVTLSPSV
jgi:hypothetical protein